MEIKDMEMEIFYLNADYRKLRDDVLMLKGLFFAMESYLMENVSKNQGACLSAYGDLIERIVEDMENSFAVKVKGWC